MASTRATYPLRRKNLNKQKQQKIKTPVKEDDGLELTHVRSRARTIRMVMRRWHVGNADASCCPYHHASRTIDEVVEYMLAQPCDCQWEALKVQCNRCSCMNNNNTCLVCGQGGQ